MCSVCTISSIVNVVSENLTEWTKLNLFRKPSDQIDYFKNYFIELNIDPKSREKKVIK